jgi:hypothetical protein
MLKDIIKKRSSLQMTQTEKQKEKRRKSMDLQKHDDPMLVLNNETKELETEDGSDSDTGSLVDEEK